MSPLEGRFNSALPLVANTLNELKSSVERLDSITARHSMSLPELAYRFVLRQPTVSTALLGASSVAELDSASDFPTRDALNEDILEEIKAVQVNRPEQLILATGLFLTPKDKLMIVIDAHLDLPMNALAWKCNLTLGVQEIRQAERGMTEKGRGANTASFPEK